MDSPTGAVCELPNHTALPPPPPHNTQEHQMTRGELVIIVNPTDPTINVTQYTVVNIKITGVLLDSGSQSPPNWKEWTAVCTSSHCVTPSFDTVMFV